MLKVQFHTYIWLHHLRRCGRWNAGSCSS